MNEKAIPEFGQETCLNCGWNKGAEIDFATVAFDEHGDALCPECGDHCEIYDYRDDITEHQAVEGIMRVHAANLEQFEACEDGDSPICKPALGTTLCERCQRDVRGAKGACPAVPLSQRWKINFNAGIPSAEE